MCGISGIFDLRGHEPVEAELARRINNTLVHRGPDDEGLHFEPGLALGHRRLSIIDVATGQQPLANEDGSVWIVFNGEIYNFQELVPELSALGHRFKTRSDTEVIVHAWEQWGPACLERLRGMFAFALWDRNRQQLLLARDRMGVKPLFYSVIDGKWLVFGSELKAITAHPRFSKQLDAATVEDYLAYGYIPEPRTIYGAAHKLAPAHYLLLERGQSVGTPRAYWDVRFDPQPIDPRRAAEELVALLQESVRLRMISEVPLGAFLSGGVDSSAVVAMMAQISDEPVRTCSIGFDAREYDETAYAAEVARRYRTRHRTQTVAVDDFGLIDELARLYDEPFSDSSAIPTYRVSELARRDVTVALSGDGGDEVFAGYRRHRFHMAEERVRARLPLALRRPMFGALAAMYPQLDWAPRPLRARATLQALSWDSVTAYFNAVAVFRDAERQALYSSTMKRELNGYRAIEVMRDHARRAGTDDPLSLIQYLDIKTYLVGDINTKVDRASMAHSLEVREPLMDHKLVEWAARLPMSLRIANSQGKFLLKKAMEPYLPAELLYRPKQGFVVPISKWFRGPLRERVRAAMAGERLASTGWFEAAALTRLVDDHLSGARDHGSRLWSLLMLDAFLARSELSEVSSATREPVRSAA